MAKQPKTTSEHLISLYGDITGLKRDLTATLAAPGVNVGDLVSAPALDYLGLNPLNGFASGRGRGIIPTGFNALVTGMDRDWETI